MESNEHCNLKYAIPSYKREMIKNIYNYLVNKSEKYLSVQLRPEDIILSLEISNKSISNFIVENKGPIEYYSKNKETQINALLVDFEKMVKNFTENGEFLYEKKSINLKVEKKDDLTIEDLFTIDDNGNKVKYEFPTINRYLILLSTYITKIKDKTIKYLNRVNYEHFLDKYDNFLVLFNVPKKLENNLKEVKNNANTIIKKITQLSSCNNYEIIYSIYNNSKDKYLTNEGVKKVRSNFTKFCILEKSNNIYKICEIESNIKTVLDNLPIKNKSKVNIIKFHKLIKSLKHANYIFDFKFNLNLNLISDPNNREDLLINSIGQLDAVGSLITKDYNILKNEICEGNTKIFGKSKPIDIEEIQTFDLNFPDNISCKTCNINILPNDAIYYCYWCKIFFCEKCVEDKWKNYPENNENLIQMYLHKEHNLIYIKHRVPSKLKDLGLTRLGKNAFAERTNCLGSNHSAICNGCGGGFTKTPRFICISCRPGVKSSNGFIDFCYKCVKHIRSEDDEGKRIIKISQFDRDINDLGYKYSIQKNHDNDHVCLVVICSTNEAGHNDYYNY